MKNENEFLSFQIEQQSNTENVCPISSRDSLKLQIRLLKSERKQLKCQSKKLGRQVCQMFGDLMSQPVTANKPNLKQDMEWAETQEGFQSELKRIQERFHDFLQTPQEAKLHAFVNFMQANGMQK